MNAPIVERLRDAVGGVEKFSRNWSWRSHSPERRAEDALASGSTGIAAGAARLKNGGASETQIEEWTAKAIRLWLAYQAAGARTANPMITGPANFPVARNQKAIAVEVRRCDEFYEFLNGAQSWLSRRRRSAERAVLSAVSATQEHDTIEANGLKLVGNKTLDRVQLIFPDRPDAEMRAALKERAFRWSPREGAWQRKFTRNGVIAAHQIKRIWLGEQP